MSGLGGMRFHRHAKATTEDRFWAKVDRRGPDECWPWLAAKDGRGYGMFSLPRGTAKMIRASRFVCTLVHGEPAAGLEALHSCDNPPCCNPAHLSWGTHGRNMREAGQRGRLPPPHTAKLTATQAAEAIRRRAAGERVDALAAEFGISAAQMSRVSRGLSTSYAEG